MRVAGRNVSKFFGNDGNVTRLGGADNPKRLPKMFRKFGLLCSRPHSGAGHDGRMDDRDARPARQVQVREVQPGTAGFEQVLTLAARALAQDR